MVYVLAVAAALSNALTSVFQRMGVEDAPEETTMRLSLMAHAIRRGIWLLGFGFMICSFLLQAFALHIGRLSVVQPILTMELLFLVAILGTYFRFPISYRGSGSGPAAIAFGLAGFLYFAAPGGGNEAPTNLGWIVVGGGTTCPHRPRRRGHPLGSALVEGGHVRHRGRHHLCLHRRPDQGGERLRRKRLGRPCSCTGRPTGSSSSACSASS